ncbi:O-antigen acetylase [Photobacterium aphoticum]|uniref:O-antigen acetylase n=1 Tax=Photobacterium aphoticum TaxID=754436 RepID=A0A090QZQ0_9GAMM|nr:O-antigen acetylase [Photobacterium aphoticum]
MGNDGGWNRIFLSYNVKKNNCKKVRDFWTIIDNSILFMFDSNDLWPGYLALVPVLGAYFVIISCQNESKLTNNIVFKYIGLWSYSIYLWHWPLVVYGKYYNVENWSLVGIILSIILGVISFNLIEGHISKNMVGGKVKISFIVLLLPLIISFTGYVYNKNGLVERFDQEKREILQSAQRAVGDWNYPKPNLNISKLYIRYIDNKSDKNILFIGASHIEQVYPYVSKLKIDYNVYFLTMGGCFVTPSMKHPQWECSNIQNYKVLLESVRFEKIVTSFYNFNSYLPKDGLLERAKEYDEFLLNIKNHAQEVF